MGTIVIVIGIAAGCYEVISRAIPTSKGWSIVGKIIDILKKISDALDKKKN